MRFIFFLTLVLPVISAAAAVLAQQKEYKLETDVFFNETTQIMQDLDGKPLTGIVKVDDCGTLNFENKYKNGRLDGVQRYYNREGKISWETLYKDGEIQSARKYYENGNIKLETAYKNSRGEGISRQYYENGKIKEEIRYKDGKKEGLAKNYFPDGLEVEIIYKDDEALSGICIRADGKTIRLLHPEAAYFNNADMICR